MSRKWEPFLLGAGLVAAWVSAAAAGESPADALAREIQRHAGVSWYGVYFGGQQKCGVAKITIARDKWNGHDAYTTRMGMDVTIRMAGGPPQKFQIRETRRYRLTGELVAVESATWTRFGRTDVRCEVKGDQILVRSTKAGRTTTTTLPAPPETLAVVLAGRRLMNSGKIGGTIEFKMFEPNFLKVITVRSKLLRFEDRMIDGVRTRLAVVESTFRELGMQSTEYLTENGDLIETVVGRFFTLRKEPKNRAKDVRHAYDPIRSGLIKVGRPLGDGRNITSLTLRISGVPRPDALIDDDRQAYTRGGDGPGAWHTLALRPSRRPGAPRRLPVRMTARERDVARWLKPSPFVQSDAPEVIRAAKQIVGDTTDAFTAAGKINDWVFRNVRKEYVAAMSNTLDVLRKKRGDCSEHAVLFVGLCRAAGIPARQAVGVGYSRQMGGFGYHAWGEVYVGRWVAMDPTWGQRLADATHIKFAVGDTDYLGAVAGLFGSLKIKVVDVKRK